MRACVKELQDKFEITAHPQNAGHARDRVRALAVQAGFQGLPLADIEIAVGEAITNAILYGSPSAGSHIIIACYLEQNVFHVEVRDQGHGFDPALVRLMPESDALGGRGIRLMRALADEVWLLYDDHGMTAHLTKNLFPGRGHSNSES